MTQETLRLYVLALDVVGPLLPVKISTRMLPSVSTLFESESNRQLNFIHMKDLGC